MSIALLCLASVIFLIAFVDYNRGFIMGKNTPAFAAWAMFSLITTVNGATYLDLSGKWINTLLFFTDALVCIGTATIVFVQSRGKVEIDQTDKRIMLVSLIAVLLWAMFNASKGGNLINLVALTLAFVPTYRNVLGNPKSEPARPWALWSFAFVLNIVALALQKDTRFMDFVSPVVYLVHHVAIAVLSLPKKPTRPVIIV